MSEELRTLLEAVKAGIDRLRSFEFTTNVHCSKIHSLLRAFFQLRPMLDSFLPRKKGLTSRKVKKSLKKLNASLETLEDFCRKCSDKTPQFQDFVITTSIKEIFDTFFAIRQDSINALNKVGWSDAAQLFVMSPDLLCNENQVDLKRLYGILLQMKKKSISESKEFRDHMSKRMESMAAHGICTGDDADIINIPKTDQFLLSHDDIEAERNSCAQIGNGHSATVTLGRIKGEDQLYAIKALKCRSLSPPELESLRREIVILSSLSHPSLLKLRGYTNEWPFCLVTEYMKNGSLFAFLRDRPEELTPTDRTLIAFDVASGMAYMHDQRVMHRDLKSLNILLDENKKAKLCDFGLARLITHEPMSGLVGTAQWMAPEVLLSDPSYDAKIDVYSFGIVIWELLTSRVPYAGIDLAILPRLVVNDGLRPEIPKETPPELANLMTSCWNANPMLRPSFHQITQLLSSPKYVFPGTDESLLPRNYIRHSVSTSDPMKLDFGSVRQLRRPHKTLSEGRMRRSLRPVDSNVFHLAEAIEKRNDTKMEKAISKIRSSLKQNKLGSSPEQFISDLMGILSEVFDSRRAQLMRLLAESFVIPDVFKAFLNHGGVEFLCDMLETKDKELVDLVLAVIEGNPSIELFSIEMIRSLLSFYNFPEIKIRGRALNLLLVTARQQRSYLCTVPSFISHLLDFTMLQLPERLWDGLLNTSADLISGIDTIPEALILRLSQLLSRVPEEFWPRAVNCISVSLRFPEMRASFPESYWALARRNFGIFKSFFISFIRDPPEDPTVMIASLVDIARSDNAALTILIQFSKDERCSKSVLSCLPVRNRTNDALLLRLYTSLIEAGYEADVYQENEFYSVLLSLIASGVSDYVCQLLRSPHVDIPLVQALGYVDAISRAITSTTDQEVLWNLLSIVHKWCTKQYIPEFEGLIPHLLELVERPESQAKLGSFLCLTVFAEHTPSMDCCGLIKAALYYVSHESELIQDVSKTFLEKNMTLYGRFIPEFASIFLQHYKFTPASVAAAKTIVNAAERVGIKLPDEVSRDVGKIAEL